MSYPDLRALISSHPLRDHGVGTSDAEFALVDGELGLRVRGTYQSFLREFGWASIGSLELYGLGVGCPPYLDLVAVTKSERVEMQPALPHHLLPVLNDGFGNLFCVDTSRHADEPPIVLWDHDAGVDQGPETVSASFADWFNELVALVHPMSDP